MLQHEHELDADTYFSGKAFLDALLWRTLACIVQVRSHGMYKCVCTWLACLFACLFGRLSAQHHSFCYLRRDRVSTVVPSAACCACCCHALSLFLQSECPSLLAAAEMSSQEWRIVAANVLEFRKQHGGWPWREL